MSGQGDDDRTLFGQSRPLQVPPAGTQDQQPKSPWPQAPFASPPAAPVDDGDKTLFGTPPQGTPAIGGAPQAPAPRQYGVAPAAPPSGAAEDTWLGGRLPPAAPYGQGRPAAPPPAAADGNTWFGGASPQSAGQQPYQPQVQRPPVQQPPVHHAPAQPYPPQPYPPAQQPYAPYPPQNAPPAYPPAYSAPPPHYSPYAQPAGHPPQPQNWRAQTLTEGQFPMVPAHGAQPAQLAPVPRISFHDALRGAGIDIGASTNPLLAAATGLLVLFGRLRTGMVEMQAIPLRDHVIREIGAFVKTAQSKGVPPEDIEIARYALAATADDIVQTVPGSDPGYWQQYSMAAELLNDRSAGIGFFVWLDQVIAYPLQRKWILELMLTCLHLGFEGKYRTEPNGLALLARLRNEVYQRLRSVEHRPEPDLSINWLPVVLSGKRNAGSVPLWFIAAVGGATVVALFASLSWILSRDTNAAQAAILGLNDPRATVAIESAALNSREPYLGEVDNTQLERIRDVLSAEIAAGTVIVDKKGDYLMIRVGEALRFGSGSADLASDFAGLAAQIGKALDTEPGKIIVEGHSDNVPLRGTGRYRTNEELSQARAQTVRDILVQSLADPERTSVVGVGPNDPVDTSGTREAQALNRRVEILLQQENGL